MARRKKPSSDVGSPAAEQPEAFEDSPLAGYGALLHEIKERIRVAKIRAALAVNRELVTLYWDIGRLIVERQHAEGWGAATVNRLAQDLQTEFPGVAGFSAGNVRRMRAFYRAWSEPKSAQAVRKLELGTEYAQPARKLESGSNLAQPVREMGRALLPQAAAEIPWGHNIVLVEKLDDSEERLWYAQKTVEHGWSRAVLVHQIESGLCRRQGSAISNFDATLPAPESDLAHAMLKDPYVFDFLQLSEEVRERELEDALIESVERFLLELGVGFALLGRQYRLNVGGDEFFIDLLFYHARLHCYVVIELKVDAFKPEYAGKLNFYLAAVDDLLRQDNDRPTIGLILCRERNEVVARYSLQNANAPMAVSTWVLTSELPVELTALLPTVEQVQQHVQVFDSDTTALRVEESATVRKR